MLKYDSTHGRFDGTVEAYEGKLVVNGKAISVSNQYVFLSLLLFLVLIPPKTKRLKTKRLKIT